MGYMDSLIAHYDMSDPNPQNLAPRTVGLNNGIGVGLDASNIVRGVSDGMATKFNGSDEYVNIGTGVNPASGDFAVACLIKLVHLGASQVFISNREAGAPYSGYYFVISVTNQLGYQLNDQSNFHVYAVGTKTLVAGTLYHIVLSIDRGNNLGHLYIDGDADTINTDISAVSGSIISTQDTWIGMDSVVGSPIEGPMDEVMMFDSALTQLQAIDLGRRIRMGRL